MEIEGVRTWKFITEHSATELAKHGWVSFCYEQITQGRH